MCVWHLAAAVGRPPEHRKARRLVVKRARLARARFTGEKAQRRASEHDRTVIEEWDLGA